MAKVSVSPAVGLAKARKVVEMEHLDRVFRVKPKGLVGGLHALISTADAAQDLVCSQSLQ